MDKITRTKLAMLVTSVILTIITTIALYYTMTVSHVTTLGGSDTVVMNIAMVMSIMIAFMWVVCLILFYEFKTDDLLRDELAQANEKIVELKARASELETFEETLRATTFRPAVVDMDVIMKGVSVPVAPETPVTPSE